MTEVLGTAICQELVKSPTAGLTAIVICWAKPPPLLCNTLGVVGRPVVGAMTVSDCRLRGVHVLRSRRLEIGKCQK